MMALAWAPSMVSASPAVEDDAQENPLSTVNAVVLGVVEGVTEYLPVSSTGHLLVAERIMGLGDTESDKAAFDTYTIVIQLGAILAVLGIYRNRFILMIQGLLGRSAEGRRLLGVIIVAFVPAAVVGVAFGDAIKEHLLAPWPIVAAWAVGGVVILWFDRRMPVTARIPSLPDLPLTQAVLIGLGQTLALWPGVSRSLVTIIAGLLVGLSMSAAVEFSFLLGFVTLSAATVYELAGNGSVVLETFGIATPLLGIVVAGLAAFVAVSFMINWLNKRGMALFGWYRLGIAMVASLLLLGGAI